MNLRGIIMDNPVLKTASLVLALVLWFLVNGQREAVSDLSVPVAVRNLPSGFIVAGAVPQFVGMRVSGPKSILMRLPSRMGAITLDLRGTKEGSITFTGFEKGILLPEGVTVTRVSPSEIRLRLEPARKSPAG